MDINLTLPEHAVQYMAQLCEMRRATLNELLDASQYGLGFEAEFDSINAIECALPDIPGDPKSG